MPRVRSRHPLRRLALAACAARARDDGAPSAARGDAHDRRALLPAGRAAAHDGRAASTPDAPLTVALDGQALSYRRRLDAEPPTPPARSPARSRRRRSRPASRSSATRSPSSDGTQRPRARFTVTRPAGADFQPTSGDPRTLRARFSRVGLRARRPSAVRACRCGCTGLEPGRTARASAALGTHRRRLRRARRRRRGASSRSRRRRAAGCSCSTRTAATACKRRPTREDPRARPLAPAADPMRRRFRHASSPPSRALAPCSAPRTAGAATKPRSCSTPAATSAAAAAC